MKTQNSYPFRAFWPQLFRAVRCVALSLAVWFFSAAPGANGPAFSTGFAQDSKKEEILTNKSVLELQRLGLSEDNIIQKIKGTKCNFDVSMEGLGVLSEAKVSQPVINAMLAKQAAVASGGDAPAVAGDPNDPNAAHDEGVYFYEEANGQKKMTKILLESGNISGGGGPFGGSQRAVLSGLRAKLQLTTPRPVFYMYLGAKGGTQVLGGMTPAQLPLVKLEVKDTKKRQDRSVVIGSHGGGPWNHSTSIGIQEKFKVPLDEQELRPGVYKITPQHDLVEGEYGFAQVGSGFAMAVGQIFCFGMHAK